MRLLERKMIRLENDILVQNHDIEKNRVEIDANGINHCHQLVAHGDKLKIVEESAKC